MKTAKHLLGFLTLAFLVFAGCHELGHDGLGGGYGDPANTLRGIAMGNDPRYSSFLIQTDDGRQLNFYYDAQTRVRYRDRDYPLQSIQQGDYLVVRTRRTNQPPPPIADLITVTSTAQARPGSGSGPVGRSRFERIEGSVQYVDARRSAFSIRDQNNAIVTVTVPADASTRDRDRFSHLQVGTHVRLEGRFTDRDNFELEAFR